jgi:hypothetical protein
VDEGLRLKPIPAGGIATIEGHLRGLIVQDTKRDYSKTICVVEMIRLVATLPDIGREPASVSVEKQIVIRYPLQMELLQCPSWLSPISTSRISWKVLPPPPLTLFLFAFGDSRLTTDHEYQ